MTISGSPSFGCIQDNETSVRFKLGKCNMHSLNNGFDSLLLLMLYGFATDFLHKVSCENAGCEWQFAVQIQKLWVWIVSWSTRNTGNMLSHFDCDNVWTILSYLNSRIDHSVGMCNRLVQKETRALLCQNWLSHEEGKWKSNLPEMGRCGVFRWICLEQWLQSEWRHSSWQPEIEF